MKTKNNLTTGIIIGICVVVLPLILMSTTYTTEKNNRFELHNSHQGVFGFVLDTETGDVWRINGMSKTRTFLPEKRD
jgi:hypothetical protein